MIVDNTQTMKQGIRQSIIAARQKLALADKLELSRRITEHLVELPAYINAETVLGYMSFGAEFASEAWVRRAIQDGKQVLLPRVNRETRQLNIYKISDLQRDVAPGSWDIPEPVISRCELVEALEVIDFVLLPGVAFGRDGARLGYGGGYYDKLLERIEQRRKNLPELAAAAFAMQLISGIPMDANDRRVNWVVTEQEIIDCRTRK